MSNTKSPTHNLCVKIESRSAWIKVGVAWQTSKGHLNIKIDPLIDLSRMGPGDYLTLFPVRATTSAKITNSSGNADDWGDAGKYAGLPTVGDDEIPF